MATLYAKTAGGNWSAAGTWSNVNASGVDNSGPPTAADDVVFELLSGNVTIDTGGTRVCRSLDCTSGTGSYTGTLTHSASTALSIGDGTAGAGNVAIKLAAGMTFSVGNQISSTTNFISTSATQQTITSAGKIIGQPTFNASSNGSWILSDNFSCGSAATFFVTKGTLDTNGKSITCGFFDCTGSATRSLTLGATTITAAGNVSFTSTGLTFSGGSSTITMNGTLATFAGAGLTFGTVNINSSDTFTVASITGANTFGTLTRTGAANKICELSLSANQTITGTLTLNGNSAVNRVFISSNTIGTARTLTAATVVTKWCDFQDITGAGAGNWDLTAQATDSSGDCGGNSGITFTTSATQTATGTASFTWSTHGWTTRVPLPQDDVVISNAFIAGRTVTLDMPRAGRTINWTGATGTPDWAKTTATVIYGGLTMISGMTNSGTTNLTFSGRSSYDLDCGTQTITNPVIINALGGTIRLTGNFLCSAANGFVHTRGTLNANNFNVTTTLFNSNNSNTRTITMGSGTWTLTDTSNIWNISTATNLTFNANTSLIESTYSGATAVTFNSTTAQLMNNIKRSAGSGSFQITGVNCNDLDFTGSTGAWTSADITLRGNLTIASGMSVTAGATTITFAATSGTQVIKSNSVVIGRNFTFNGVGGTFQLFDNLDTGTARTITLTNGTFDANNKNVSTGIFSSSNSNTRVITMGSGIWTLGLTGTVWTTATATGLTLTSTGSTISITDVSGSSKTIAGGGKTFNDITITTGGAGAIIFTGANTIARILVTGGSTKTITFPASTTTTFTGTQPLPSGASLNLITMNSSSGSLNATLSSPNIVDCDYVSLTRVPASDAIPFYAGANSTDGGNNTNWVFTARPVTNIKTHDGLADASVKKINGTARGLFKSRNGLT